MALIEGKVVVVTGGARGIGAAICRVLALEGACVGVNYAGSQAAAEEVVRSIVEQGGRAIAIQADVRDKESVRTMLEHVTAEFGRVDGIVNNAISGKQKASLDEATDEDYENAFDFGCRAVVNTVTAARPYFKEQGGGRIVNIVTELWNSAPASWTVYMAGKGAMVGLSRSLAAELGPENITLNMVAPGWMADEKVDVNSDASKGYAGTTPLRRHGSADEIGNACAFFLSDLASFVTGSYLLVNGGRSTQMGA